jgi:chromosome segregation ATPase
MDSRMQPQQNPESPENSSPAASEASVLARLEGNLKERRAELTRVMAEMRDLYHSGRSQAQQEIDSLRHELGRAREQLENTEQELAALRERSRDAKKRVRETQEQYGKVLAEAETALAEQGAEISRLVDEFKEAHAQAGSAAYAPPVLLETKHGGQADVAMLPPQAALELVEATKHLAERAAEIRRLRETLAERDKSLEDLQAQHYAAQLTLPRQSEEVDDLRTQLAVAREEVKAATDRLGVSVPANELTQLREDLALTRCKLQEANLKAASAAAMVPSAVAERLRTDLLQTREQLQEANRKFATLTTAPVAEFENPRNELARARMLFQDAGQNGAPMRTMLPAAEADKLRGDMARLREQLQEATRKAAAAANMVSAAEAEKLRTELIRTREQLQAARASLTSASTLAMPAAPPAAPAELEKLQKELSRLKINLAEKEKALRSSVPASDVDKLISELSRTRSEVARLQQSNGNPINAAEIDQLRAELTILQEETREKDRKLQEMQASVSAPHTTNNGQVGQYEAELIRYHRQLESERGGLNEAIENLEKRNAELVKAAERAQQDLAHERAQLNQLRDELHIDLAFEDLAFLARKHLAPIQPAKKK